MFVQKWFHLQTTHRVVSTGLKRVNLTNMYTHANAQRGTNKDTYASLSAQLFLKSFLKRSYLLPRLSVLTAGRDKLRHFINFK